MSRRVVHQQFNFDGMCSVPFRSSKNFIIKNKQHQKQKHQPTQNEFIKQKQKSEEIEENRRNIYVQGTQRIDMCPNCIMHIFRSNIYGSFLLLDFHTPSTVHLCTK